MCVALRRRSPPREACARARVNSECRPEPALARPSAQGYSSSSGAPHGVAVPTKGSAPHSSRARLASREMLSRGERHARCDFGGKTNGAVAPPGRAGRRSRPPCTHTYRFIHCAQALARSQARVYAVAAGAIALNYISRRRTRTRYPLAGPHLYLHRNSDRSTKLLCAPLASRAIMRPISGSRIPYAFEEGHLRLIRHDFSVSTRAAQ